jgi:hypothetical protein
MTTATLTKPSKSFLIIAILALLWNLMGMMSFIMDVTISEEALASLPDGQRALYETTPIWTEVLYGIAVLFGTVGCVLLLMKKSFAIPIFVISFMAILIQMTYWLAFTNSLEVYGPAGAVMPLLVIFIGAFLIWYSNSAKVKGWII